MEPLRVEVFPVEPDRWIAVIDAPSEQVRRLGVDDRSGRRPSGTSGGPRT